MKALWFSSESNRWKNGLFVFVQTIGDVSYYLRKSDIEESQKQYGDYVPVWVMGKRSLMFSPCNLRQLRNNADTDERLANRETLLTAMASNLSGDLDRLPPWAEAVGYTAQQVARSREITRQRHIEAVEHRDAENRRKQEEQEQREQAAMSLNRATVQNGGRISGSELVDVARSLGIDVHPRTVGMLRNKIAWIEPGKMACHSSVRSYSPYDVYSQCQELLTKELAEV